MSEILRGSSPEKVGREEQGAVQRASYEWDGDKWTTNDGGTNAPQKRGKFVGQTYDDETKQYGINRNNITEEKREQMRKVDAAAKDYLELRNQQRRKENHRLSGTESEELRALEYAYDQMAYWGRTGIGKPGKNQDYEVTARKLLQGLEEERKAQAIAEEERAYEQKKAAVISQARKNAGKRPERSMAAAMYDAETNQIYSGWSRHNQGQGNVPKEIWDKIPITMNPEAYMFGLNCAEVECVIAAYANGKQSTDLTRCFFSAAQKAQGNQALNRCPCGSCQNWIKATGGESYMPRV